MALSALWACDECANLSLDRDKIEKSIRRLNSILQVNQDFIQGLDPEDHSERIKAQSNVNIAKKRISALKSCSDCLSKSGKNG
ncbi:hypothetical protein WDW37_01980 [Bdellovibrionota bacterium FG-1]